MNFQTPHDPGSRAVLWDMDGTIIDTGPLHWAAWHEAMTANGYDISYRFFVDTFGQRNETILSTLLGPGASPAEIARVSDAKEARYRELIRSRGIDFLPGVETWLRRLHEAGWRQALASSAPRLNIETVLGALDLGPCLDAIVCSEDVRHGKPDPQVYLLAASRVSVLPGRCVVVEDSPYGIEGARRAGMHWIRVGDSAAHEAVLSAEGWTVDRMDQLPAGAFDRLVAG